MTVPLNSRRPSITLSVISHGHGPQVLDMLQTFIQSGLLQHWQAEVIVTLNLPEPALAAALKQTHWPFPVRILENDCPKGYGANHNQALQNARSDWVCIANPDIRWCPITTPPALTTSATGQPIGLYCPAQVSDTGTPQDYARTLPTPWGVAARWAARRHNTRTPPGTASSVSQAHWVNGACMLLPAAAYHQLGGFDKGYFMYCEDVDLCLRLQLHGYRLAALSITVVHAAQRNTRRQRQHLYWHIRSLLRLWVSSTFWRYCWRTRGQHPPRPI